MAHHHHHHQAHAQVGLTRACMQHQAQEPRAIPTANGSRPDLDRVSGDAFLAISNWAKETGNLTPWDRRFAYTIGVRLNGEQPLTPKQAPHAERILETVRGLGFDPYV